MAKSKRPRKNDGYLGKVEFWTKELERAKKGESKYTVGRCQSSLRAFTDLRKQHLAKKAQEEAPMIPPPADAKQRAIDACRAKFEGLNESERMMLANKIIKDAAGMGISVNDSMAFIKDAEVMSDTELIHSIMF